MSNAETPDEEVKELFAYGAGLQSLSEIVGLNRFVKLELLSLHGNHIERIQGLEGLAALKELNLSSNNIKEMEGLAQLSQLQVLNLSCNRIEGIKDVQGLRALRKLVLSHNRISCLGGLSSLHGPRYALQILDMRDNLVSSLAEMRILAGCVNLTELIFSWGTHTNPVCQDLAYKSAVVAAVPHILKLDGKTLFPGPSHSPQAPSPSWPLQFKDDSLQALPFDIDRAPPRQTILQPQPEIATSSKNRKKPSEIHQMSSGTFLPMGNLSHPHIDQVSSSTFEPGTAPGHGMSINSSSELPLIKRSPTNCNAGKNPRPATFQRGLDVPDANQSSQTSHEAWLGALEEKILNLVQQLPIVKQNPHGELTNRHDDRMVSSGGSNVRRCYTCDTSDVLRHRKRKENARDQEMSNVKPAASSSGDLSEPGLQILSRSLSSNGDSGSESPPRRWVHFGQKRKELKDLKSPGRNSGKEIPVTLDNDVLKQLYEEVRNLQAGLASLTSTHGGAELPEKKFEKQSEMTIELKQNEKEAIRRLTRELTLLESKLATAEAKFSEEKTSLIRNLESAKEEKRRWHEILKSEQEENSKLLENLKAEQEERNKLRESHKAKQEEMTNLQKSLEAAESKICRLEQMLQENDAKEQELNKKTEDLVAERAQTESFLHEKYRGKFLSQNTQLISVKEALNVATQARQNAESALLDATAEKESSRQLAVSLGQLLEEEKGKLRMCNAQMEDCRSLVLELREQVEKSSNECLNAKTQHQEAMEQLKKLHKQEMQEAIAREFAAGESTGMLAAQNAFDMKSDQVRHAMDLKLRDSQKELQKAQTELVKIREDMDNLRNEKEREEATLKETIRRVLLKEQEKETLVAELSSVVRSQKIKLQTTQFDLERLAEAEEDLQKMHQDIIVVRRKADKCDDLTFEVESLQKKMAEVTSDAERQKEAIAEKFQAQLDSLQKENKILSAKLQNLESSEDAIKVKNKMLDSQNETIKELKLELSQTKEVFRDTLKASEAVQAEWTRRLQIEINQREALQNKFATQGVTVTSLEEKLRFERAAKLAAEKASKALQEKLTEKEGMFSYVEEEILQVKELYDRKLKDVGVERDRALEEIKMLHQEKEKLEDVLADAQRRREELLKAAKNREDVLKAEVNDKTQQLAQALERVVELERKLQSQDHTMESQKHILVSKLDQLHKLFEELREGN